MLTDFRELHIPIKSESRPQTGPDHFFYALQRRKIEKANQAKAGRRMKLAPHIINKGRPKKVSPVKPTDKQLIELFNTLKSNGRIGKFSRNGHRIVA